jgi:hypothetical protein
MQTKKEGRCVFDKITTASEENEIKTKGRKERKT